MTTATDRTALIRAHHRAALESSEAAYNPAFVPDRTGELTLAEKRRLVADFGREALIRYGLAGTLPEAFERD
jgi:hypothetical protein